MLQGTYADDCLVSRVTQHKAYIVATCDKDLKRRIRKIPGVPIMFLSNHRYSIERMPDAYGAPKDRWLSMYFFCRHSYLHCLRRYIFISEASLVNIMGKGPKHNSKSRNNGIFKVAGQNFKQGNKGKPKEVTSKLKLVWLKIFLSLDRISFIFLFRSRGKTMKKLRILTLRWRCCSIKAVLRENL